PFDCCIAILTSSTARNKLTNSTKCATLLFLVMKRKLLILWQFPLRKSKNHRFLAEVKINNSNKFSSLKEGMMEDNQKESHNKVMVSPEGGRTVIYALVPTNPHVQAIAKKFNWKPNTLVARVAR